MSLEHATASSSIDPAAATTLIAPSNNPSPTHTSRIHQELPPPEPYLTSTPPLGTLSSSRLAEHTERIPKLSATTTEILARVNGNIKETIQGLGITEHSNPGYNNDRNTLMTSNMQPMAETMKDSSTTVTFPAKQLTPPQEQTSKSTMKSEPVLSNTMSNSQSKVRQNDESVVAPKPIQLGATPLSTTVATPSTSARSASTASKRQKNAARRGNGGAKRGKKRKRGSKHDDDDDDSGSSSDEATPSATQTKSGRQIHRPTFLAPVPKEPTASPDVQPTRKRRRIYRKGKEINVTCNHCQRGHSPTSNVIVFCDECNGAWHQFCHDPPIGADVIQVKEAEWFCRECRPASNSTDNFTDTIAAYPDVKPADRIDKIVSIPFTTRVGGEQFSAAEKHAHLSKLSHTALVNLLMDISSSNPSLPIFPSNLSQSHGPSYLPAVDTAASTPATSMTTTTTNTSFASTAPTSAKSPNNTPPIVISGPSLNNEGVLNPEDDEYEDVEEHRLYPKPGNGFRLPPESEDLDMLLEDPLCPTFSHSLHGPAKARAEAAAMVGLSSMA
jgi:hypothetical protein